jgi:hypothetical protein
MVQSDTVSLGEKTVVVDSGSVTTEVTSGPATVEKVVSVTVEALQVQ